MVDVDIASSTTAPFALKGDGLCLLKFTSVFTPIANGDGSVSVQYLDERTLSYTTKRFSVKRHGGRLGSGDNSSLIAERRASEFHKEHLKAVNRIIDAYNDNQTVLHGALIKCNVKGLEAHITVGTFDEKLWLDCVETIREFPTHSLTKSVIIKVASLYGSVNDFKAGSRRVYNHSQKYGVYGEATAHMMRGNYNQKGYMAQNRRVYPWTDKSGRHNWTAGRAILVALSFKTRNTFLLQAPSACNYLRENEPKTYAAMFPKKLGRSRYQAKKKELGYALLRLLRCKTRGYFKNTYRSSHDYMVEHHKELLDEMLPEYDGKRRAGGAASTSVKK